MKTCVRNAFFFIALATSSLDALAALYEIPSTSLASGAYISKASVQGLFDISAILPADTHIKSASVRFLFTDDSDNSRVVETNSYPEIGTYIAQPPVTEGTTIRNIYVRTYDRVHSTTVLFDRETVNVYMGDNQLIGSVTPIKTMNTISSESLAEWQLDHRRSDRYLYGEDCSSGICTPIFGTKFFEYYNNARNVDRTTYLNNETDFSLISTLTSPELLAQLMDDGSIGFSLKATGDALLKAAYLYIEASADGTVPEPSPIYLALTGLVLGLAFLRKPKAQTSRTKRTGRCL